MFAFAGEVYKALECAATSLVQVFTVNSLAESSAVHSTSKHMSDHPSLSKSVESL